MRAIMAMTAALALGSVAAGAEEPAATVRYAYPAQARAIPPLKAWLDRQAAALRTDTVSEATSDRDDAARAHRPFSPYQSDRSWKVVTDTPRFLSLSLERYDFAGGAHGNGGFGALVWDRETQSRLTPMSFFVSAAALTAALRPDFCRRLDAERLKRRGGEANSADEPADFDRCIDPTRQTVILGVVDPPALRPRGHPDRALQCRPLCRGRI